MNVFTWMVLLWHRYQAWSENRKIQAQERDRQFDQDSEALLLSVATSPEAGLELVDYYSHLSRDEKLQFVTILRAVKE